MYRARFVLLGADRRTGCCAHISVAPVMMNIRSSLLDESKRAVTGLGMEGS